MRFDELPHGSQVFIDANIFIYHFSGVSAECSDFLELCEQEKVIGFTTTHIVLEVMHRLMMLEAVTKGFLTPGNVAQKLKQNPMMISNLSDYADCALRIPEMGISVLPITMELCESAVVLQRDYGVMNNDSLLAAACQSRGCSNLASNDLALARIKGLVLFQPSDIV